MAEYKNVKTTTKNEKKNEKITMKNDYEKRLWNQKHP